MSARTKIMPAPILFSHELGQHWFGDYVQRRDWANIWPVPLFFFSMPAVPIFFFFVV